jgi:hypothetical protein
VHAVSEEKSADSKGSCHEQLEQVFDNFAKYHTKRLLRDFNSNLGIDDIFKPIIENDSLHQDSNDNGVIIVHFATPKIELQTARCSHAQTYTWTSPDGKIHNQTDHTVIGRRWHSSTLDVRSFRGADCDTDHYLMVAKLREKLAASKESAQKFDGERFNLRTLSELEVMKQYQIEISKSFAALEDLDDGEDINRAWENIKDNIRTSTKVV